MCAFYFFWLSASHDLRLGMDGMLLAPCDHGSGSRDLANVSLIIIIIIIIMFCVCVFFQFIQDIKFVGRTNRGHTGGRSHMISHPLSFCGACLDFSREKDSAIPFPRRP